MNAPTFPVTAQMVVKNEDRFVWFAITAVLPYVARFLITDTGSTDQTVKIIKSIKNPKIILETKAEDVVAVRKKQLLKTKTPWFLLVDGDEVWSQRQLFKLLQLIKELPKGKIAVVNQTKNCVGDVWHCLPPQTGKYQFGKWQGHLNVRLMRTLPYQIGGQYPWEEYRLNGESINHMTEALAYSPAWYLHLSHLNRSSSKTKTLGRRQLIIEKGESLDSSQMPEVFFTEYPSLVKNPLTKRSFWYELPAALISPLKDIKRQLLR